MKCPESNSTDKLNEPISVCLKETTIEKDKMITTRSCAAESRQFVVCSIVPSIGHCSTCENDLCNSAGRQKTNLMMSFVTVLVTMSLKFI